MKCSCHMLMSLVEGTNKYSLEKHGHSEKTSSQECEQSIGVIFYMGLVQMPNLCSYWENELGYEHVSTLLSCDCFLKLLTLLHFLDNNAISDEEKNDKLW